MTTFGKSVCYNNGQWNLAWALHFTLNFLIYKGKKHAEIDSEKDPAELKLQITFWTQTMEDWITHSSAMQVKAHVNILHVQNTIVSCLSCFCSHLQELILFYFKMQAVSSWHFEHKAIMVKYLPNVSSSL